MTRALTHSRNGRNAAVAEEVAHIDINALRADVSEALNRLGAQLVARMSEVALDADDDRTLDPVTAGLQARIGRLGQIAAGLAVVVPECLPERGAGYGSVVEVKDVATGETDQYMLMVGSLVDIDANQVSLASPIGQALLGREAGEEITITTPHKQSRLLITSVTTLMDALNADELRV